MANQYSQKVTISRQLYHVITKGGNELFSRDNNVGIGISKVYSHSPCYILRSGKNYRSSIMLRHIRWEIRQQSLKLSLCAYTPFHQRLYGTVHENYSDSVVDGTSQENVLDILSSDDDVGTNRGENEFDSSTEDDFCHVESCNDGGVSDIDVRSPLEIASDTISQESGDQERPLWMRLDNSQGKKAPKLERVLHEWTTEGYAISRSAIILTITVLRRRKKYWRALEVSNWVMKHKPYELTEMDYAIRIELIAKAHGVEEAADYFATIPKEFQTAMAYSILLTAYVEKNKEKDALKLVEKVDKLCLGHRTYMYNQLLYLYKKNGLMTGLAEILEMMDQKNVKPDVYTYNILLDVKARKGDVHGMEMVWSKMKNEEGVTPDVATFGVLAKGYLLVGLNEKAEKAVKKLEQSPYRTQRMMNFLLLKFYGQLGKEEQIERVWNLVKCGEKITTREYITMIRSLGMVKNEDRAEEVFDEMIENVGSVSVHQYNALLSVYANLGKIDKGEKFLKKIAKASFSPNGATYHELVLMYLTGGQAERAIEIMLKCQKNQHMSIRRPLYATFQVALEWFARKGDVKNAEKLVQELKFVGYTCTYRSYCALLEAYKVAQISPYGFFDRMRADNVIPNKYIRKQLRKLDGT